MVADDAKVIDTLQRLNPVSLVFTGIIAPFVLYIWVFVDVTWYYYAVLLVIVYIPAIVYCYRSVCNLYNTVFPFFILS